MINNLKIKNFRNIKEINIDLNENVNVFYGDNAQGKTNILESMFICATGKSMRTRYEKELIMFGEKNAHIQIEAFNGTLKDKIEINISSREKKNIYINNIKISKLGELFGTAGMVFFSPEDLLLIKEGPSYRRKYIDIEMCQISKVYYSNLQRYYRSLKERNNLLKKIKEDHKYKSLIDAWDEQLIKYGEKIIKQREEFIEELSFKADEIIKEITDKKENLKIIYKKSVKEEELREKLTSSREKDILYGTTSVGIHKDDIVFELNGINARDYASQGQQRSIVLALKMSEIGIIEEKTGRRPSLLLDDVLSELDIKRQNYILNKIKNIQTFITCTGIGDIKRIVDEKSSIFYVKKGNVEKKE
ncbi:MAG: DNA replication/repair protein RecF [Firmicutes bacterium]|nr:DNA replication/repair protein RecF [Bacillota bacterium]